MKENTHKYFSPEETRKLLYDFFQDGLKESGGKIDFKEIAKKVDEIFKEFENDEDFIDFINGK